MYKERTVRTGATKLLNSLPSLKDERAIWDRDFGILIGELKEVDPEIGLDLERERDFYTAACELAKGYFDKPFGGLMSLPNEFGFASLTPQDFKTFAISMTPALYSWAQTIKSSTAVLGYHGSYMFTNNTPSKREVVVFHRLLSHKPDRLTYVQHHVNDYDYAPYSVELACKITKAQRYKLIFMPSRVLLHPGAKWYATLYFSPCANPSADIEISAFGLVFAEYDYLCAREGGNPIPVDF